MHRAPTEVCNACVQAEGREAPAAEARHEAALVDFKKRGTSTDALLQKLIEQSLQRQCEQAGSMPHCCSERDESPVLSSQDCLVIASAL